MSPLLKKQQQFARMLSMFILQLGDKGYQVTFGEVKRSDEQAYINSLGFAGREELRRFVRGNPKFYELDRMLANNVGSGIRNSLHELSLAADLNLFKNGVYLQKSEEYKEAGELWEEMGGTWGGRFGDGNHFSLAHEGRK